MNRFRLLCVIAAVLGGVALGVPALASDPPQHQAATHATAPVALVAPLARQGRLSPATLDKAISACVYYASRAGWANNGYYSGDLVTAATICVAESGGDPHLIVCDGQNGTITGQGDWPGLWQLNTIGAKDVSDKCAFDPVCNAGQAYLHSARGISFAPWVSYDTGVYAAPYLDKVQAAVTKLTAGTVTSALLGECLAAAAGRRSSLSTAAAGRPISTGRSLAASSARGRAARPSRRPAQRRPSYCAGARALPPRTGRCSAGTNCATRPITNASPTRVPA